MQTAFEADLRKLIDGAIEQHKENLGLGHAPKDFAGYKEIVGKIQGLKDALALCDEVNAKQSEQ